jgi:hypothetical protein
VCESCLPAPHVPIYTFAPVQKACNLYFLHSPNSWLPVRFFQLKPLTRLEGRHKGKAIFPVSTRPEFKPQYHKINKQNQPHFLCYILMASLAMATLLILKFWYSNPSSSEITNYDYHNFPFCPSSLGDHSDSLQLLIFG